MGSNPGYEEERRVDVERTNLPGIGLRHIITTERDRRVGIVSHHNGRRDLVIYDKDDPDTAVLSVALTGVEADALAELLGTAHIVERLTQLHRQVEGVMTRQCHLEAGSPYDGRTLGETRARTRTGASVVAILRDREVIASPRPDFRLHGGDTIVAVGTEDGTEAVAELLVNG
jgi:TrkA domain protein